MLTFLFWDIGPANLIEQTLDIAEQHDVDMLVLVKSKDPLESSLLALFGAENTGCLVNYRHDHPTGTTRSGRFDCGRGAGGTELRLASRESHQAAQHQRRQAGTFGRKHLRPRKGPRNRCPPAFRRDHESESARGTCPGLPEIRADRYAGHR